MNNRFSYFKSIKDNQVKGLMVGVPDGNSVSIKEFIQFSEESILFLPCKSIDFTEAKELLKDYNAGCCKYKDKPLQTSSG